MAAPEERLAAGDALDVVGVDPALGEHRELLVAEVVADRADHPTSVKKLAASAKCTAEPPSIRSRSPNGVRTLSNAIEPTTVRATAAAS